MPKLGGKVSERIYLPTTANEPNEEDRAWVVLKEKFQLGDARVVYKNSQNENSDSLDQMIDMAAAAIFDWNFYFDDGTKIPVNVDNVALMEIEDFTYVANLAGEIARESFRGLRKDEKKDSSAISTPESVTPTISPTIS